MSGDNVSTTEADGRKPTSKPVMEKRRRARINACLVELKSLLMEVIKSEGTRQSKMEKADILEMTVRHLRQLQRQTITGARSVDPATQNKYRLGYTECINEVSRFLGCLELDEVELRTKIIDHLANCVCSSKFYEDDVTPTTSTFPYNTAVVKPRIETISSGDKTSTATRLNTTHLPIAPKPEVTTDTTGSFVLDIACSDRSPGLTTSIFPSDRTIRTTDESFSRDSDQMQTALNLTTYSTPCVASKPFTSLNIPMTSATPSPSGMCNITEPQHSQNSSQLQFIKPAQSTEQTVQSNSSTQPMHSLTSASVFSGFQIVPTKLPSGELAFVLPTNLLSSTQTPSYIIPVFSQNIPATNAHPQTISSLPTVPMIPQSVLPISGIRPLIINPVSSTLQTICSNLPLHQSPTPARFEATTVSTVSDNTLPTAPFKSTIHSLQLSRAVRDDNNNNDFHSLEKTSRNVQPEVHSARNSERDELSPCSRTQFGSSLRTGVDKRDTLRWSPGVCSSITCSTTNQILQPGTSICGAVGNDQSLRRHNLNSQYAEQLDNDGQNCNGSDVEGSRDQNNNAPGRHDDQDEDMWRPW